MVTFCFTSLGEIKKGKKMFMKNNFGFDCGKCSETLTAERSSDSGRGRDLGGGGGEAKELAYGCSSSLHL